MAFNDTFRVGAHAIIINSEGHVLMLKRTYGNKGWSLPSGSVEPGETIHQALFRECREELGIDVQSQDVVLTGLYYHRRFETQKFPIQKAAELGVAFQPLSQLEVNININMTNY